MLRLVAVVVEVTVVVVAAIKFISVKILVVRAGCGDGDGGERGCMMDDVWDAGGKLGVGGWGGQGWGLCVAAGCGGG